MSNVIRVMDAEYKRGLVCSSLVDVRADAQDGVEVRVDVWLNVNSEDCQVNVRKNGVVVYTLICPDIATVWKHYGNVMEILADVNGLAGIEGECVEVM